MPLFLYVDIETINSLEVPDISELKIPGTLKKPESIAAWWADPERQDDLDKLHHKTSTDPYAGRIFCVAWALNNDPVQVLWNDDEETLLREWQDWFASIKDISPRRYQTFGASMTLVGYNIKNFDNPYIKLRAMKYKLPLLNRIMPPRKYANTMDDMMELGLVTTRMTADKYVSQDKLARFFGLPGKGDIDGSMVWSYYKQGRKQEIADYCKDDVEQCRELHKIMVEPDYMDD